MEAKAVQQLQHCTHSAADRHRRSTGSALCRTAAPDQQGMDREYSAISVIPRETGEGWCERRGGGNGLARFVRKHVRSSRRTRLARVHSSERERKRTIVQAHEDVENPRERGSLSHRRVEEKGSDHRTGLPSRKADASPPRHLLRERDDFQPLQSHRLKVTRISCWRRSSEVL